MLKISKSVKNKIPYVFGIIIIIYIVKPNIIFKPNGKLRDYGIGYDSEGYKKTLYSFHFVILIVVLFVYLLMED
jgi:hypothetical protein